VRRSTAEDAAAGSLMATEVLGEIDRKLVKQTVMTSVYGVTISGQPSLIPTSYFLVFMFERPRRHHLRSARGHPTSLPSTYIQSAWASPSQVRPSQSLPQTLVSVV
jgi:hypothetical protein